MIFSNYSGLPTPISSSELTISIKMSSVMDQYDPASPSIIIGNEELQVTDHFTYLGSPVTNNLSLDGEISTHITKVADTMIKLSKRVRNNNQLTVNTKLMEYRACILSTLFYSSESWTTYDRQENHLEIFHLHCLRHTLKITWEDRFTNAAVLEKASSLSMHLMVCQR